jgi:hypothetical protein
MITYHLRDAKQLSVEELEVWRQLLETAGTLGPTFPHLSPPERTAFWWLDFIEDPGHGVSLVYDYDTRERLAFFWLAGQLGRAAFLNFGFLPAGLPLKEDLGRAALREIWKATGYQCLASLPGAYKLPPRALAAALGGRETGLWPGALPASSPGRSRDAVLIQFLPDGSSTNGGN